MHYCATCGLPKSEHKHDGACYGVCGRFVDIASRPETVSVPEGWKLIKTSTHDERSFPDDSERYQCKCGDCGRTFHGHKKRHQCRVCEAEPPVMNPADIKRSRAEAMAIVDRMMAEPFPKGE